MRLRTLTLAASITAFLSATLASAQSFTPIRELKNLSPTAIEKLQLLETLNELPGGDWRFHAGDIPHGESPALDDSTWQLIPRPRPRTSVRAPKDAVWYRRTVTVPFAYNGYDLTGSRIWFQFLADANGPMPQIIYFNGRRVALGDDLEPIVLFDHAMPGDKVLIAVKLLHTVDDKSYRGVALRIDPNPASTRPSPNDVRTECIAAANLLPSLPTPRKDLLPIVEQAVAAIDLDTLMAANKSLFAEARSTQTQPTAPTSAITKEIAAANRTFDASLRKAELILSPLRGVLQQDKIDLAGNSHIDAAWLWPRSETIDVVHRTFTTALQLMDEYPNYTFTQSAAQYTEWMADKYPDLNAQIKQRVKEGRWEIVGGMWVEPDLNIPDGESLVRQLLVGQRYFKDQYGVTARIGWNPDSFGYNWQLPQIYKRSGMDFFVTQKMHWNDTNTLPFRLFWWQSPDGSKVLTYFPTDYAWTNLNPTRLSADMAESQQRNPGLTEHLDLFGVGDHGGGPTRDMLDQADHWIAKSQPTEAAKSQATNNSVILSEARSAQSKDLHNSLPQQALSKLSTTETPAPEAAIPTIRYSTARHFFDNIQPHLNPTSPTWNYDTIAKGYTPPPTAPGSLSPGDDQASKSKGPSDNQASKSKGPSDNQVPQGFSLGSPNGDKNDGALAPRAPSPLIGIPTWNDELYFEYHRGIFTSQAAHKRNIRTSETATLNAEKLASFAWLQGSLYPAETLTDNWKKITFNQFHDLAAGSGIAVIYRDAQKDFTEVFNADREIDDTSLHTIDAQIDTRVSKGVPIVLHNTLAWSHSASLQLHIQLPVVSESLELQDTSDGSKVFFQILQHEPITNSFDILAEVHSVPALGYKLLRATPATPPSEDNAPAPTSPLTVSVTPLTYTIGNRSLKTTVDRKTGCLTSLSDSAHREFFAPGSCANQLQSFKDTPKQYDAWNIDGGTFDNPVPIASVGSVQLIKSGEARLTVEVRRTFNKSHFTQDISLDANADFVRVDTTVDWHETHTLLKAAFPLAATSAKATYEIPYGSIQRPTTRNNSWEKAQFEVPALRWADLGGKVGDTEQGVSILNDSKYGYDALGNTLRLTLLRSPTWPDPDADQGLQHFTYEIYPHTGPWQTAQTVHRAYELNTPLTAQQVFPHTGSLPPTHSFASVDEPNIILTAVKKAEDANALIFRFYEATGKGAAGKPTTTHLHVPPGALYAIETNLMETPIPNTPHLPLTRNSGDTDTITLPTSPYEIRTIEVVYPRPTATN